MGVAGALGGRRGRIRAGGGACGIRTAVGSGTRAAISGQWTGIDAGGWVRVLTSSRLLGVMGWGI